MKCLCEGVRGFVGRGFTGCGKFPKVSFRGRGLPEESAFFFLGLVKKQIPRFARDDIKLLFSAACGAVPYKDLEVATRTLRPFGFPDCSCFIGRQAEAGPTQFREPGRCGGVFFTRRTVVWYME